MNKRKKKWIVSYTTLTMEEIDRMERVVPTVYAFIALRGTYEEMLFPILTLPRLTPS